ncbi:MAG: hypothetical protein HWN68_12050 [Desulfobacterales bacterium]|nr:hypothetical protein [Desulfobacterales bacterium]
MTTEFRLEIFFERDEDQKFARKEAEKLDTLVKRLVPHINLKIATQKATKICPPNEHYDFTTHEPVEKDSQTLLITQEDFGPEEGRAERQGRAGPEKGCLSKRKLEEKGPKSADITIHEWIHTIVGKEINGRRIPNPDDRTRPEEFKYPDANGQWHHWYKYILRE